MQKVKQLFSNPSLRIYWITCGFLLLAALLSFLLIDKAVMNSLNRDPHPWHLQPWIDAFRQLGKAQVPIWLLVFWAAMTRHAKPLFVGIVALLLTLVVVVPVKNSVRRLRPEKKIMLEQARQTNDQDLMNKVYQGSFSFPSGDTATVFAVAAALVPFLKRRRLIGVFTAAGVVAVLRVTSLDHFVSDVCVGALVGITCGAGAVWLWRSGKLPIGPDEFATKHWQRFFQDVVLLMPLIMLYIDGTKDPLVVFLSKFGLLFLVIFIVIKYFGEPVEQA